MRRIVILLVLGLLLAATSVAGAVGLADRVTEHTLKNGMKLLLVERHTSPTVAAWIRFRVGSANERSDERGIAHLLEHMLFKGTTTLGTTDYAAEKPLLDEIEKTATTLIDEKAKGNKADAGKVAGLQKRLDDLEQKASAFVVKEEFAQIYSRNGGASYNAMTGKDGTTYLIGLPANKLELWAAIESDRMRNPVLREFYTERSVVMEERRRSYDTDPESKLYEQFLATAFVAHPYGQPIIGWMSDLENLTRTKAESFLKRYYAPNNAIIAIVGDIDIRKTIDLVERYFGDIPPGVTVPPVAVTEAPQVGEKRLEVLEDANPQLMIGFRKPAISHPDDAVFDVIDMLLADGRTSRLYRKLVMEQQLATEIGVFGAPGARYPSLFIVSGTPRAPHTAAELETAVLAELERLKTEPVTEKELQRILNKLEYEESRQMLSNGGLARNLTEYEAVAGTWRYLVEHRKVVATVTPDDIMRVARAYFTRENRTVGVIARKEESK